MTKVWTLEAIKREGGKQIEVAGRGFMYTCIMLLRPIYFQMMKPLGSCSHEVSWSGASWFGPFMEYLGSETEGGGRREGRAFTGPWVGRPRLPSGSGGFLSPSSPVLSCPLNRACPRFSSALLSGMAEASVGRALRDGSLEGEHAVALSLRDSLSCPLGAQVFGHFLRGLAANVAAGRSSARWVPRPSSPSPGPPPLPFRLFFPSSVLSVHLCADRLRSFCSGLVLVALDRSPSFYLDLLESEGLDCVGPGVDWFVCFLRPACSSAVLALEEWAGRAKGKRTCRFRVLDCYSDPLGWKARLPSSLRGGGDASVDRLRTLFTDVKDVGRLLSLVLELGRGTEEPTASPRPGLPWGDRCRWESPCPALRGSSSSHSGGPSCRRFLFPSNLLKP